MSHAKPKLRFPVEIRLQPVKVLAQQNDALAAAFVFASANPAIAHVHRLRTLTRRVEAQLALLEALTGGAAELPGFLKTAVRLAKLLKRVRRAGAVVRDLDVQRASLRELTGQAAGTDSLAGEAWRLRRVLGRRRRKAAAQLGRVLDQSQLELARRMEAAVEVLDASAGLSLPAAELEEAIRGWYRARAAQAGEARTEDAMHTVRKLAKLARYMGEANGAGALAAKFEALQDRGGTWHDLLTLAEIARDRLGKHSSLARRLAEQRDAAYGEYREHLRQFAA